MSRIVRTSAAVMLVVALSRIAFSVAFAPTTDRVRLIAVPQGDTSYDDLKPLVIRSHEQLEAFIHPFECREHWNSTRAEFVTCLLNAGINFQKEALVLIPHQEGSGSIEVQFETPYRRSHTINSSISRKVPSMQTCDMKYYCLAIVVDIDKADQIQVWQDREYSYPLPQDLFDCLPDELRYGYRSELKETVVMR